MHCENNSPVVSILILTRNRVKLLSRAIESALSQTYTYYEIIVLDGDSVDGTGELIKEYSSKDKRISYVNVGDAPPAACFNHGVRISRGEYIAILDDDDEYYPTKTEKQLNVFFENQGALGLVYCWEEYWDDRLNMKVSETKHIDRGNLYETFLNRDGAGGGTVMLIKKEAFIKAGGYDESIGVLSDMQLRLNIARHYEYDYVPEILVRTHVNHIYSRLTGNYDNFLIIQLHKKILSDHIVAYNEHPEKQLRHYNIIFTSAIAGKSLVTALSAILRVLSLDITWKLKLECMLGFINIVGLKITKYLRT